MEYSKLIHCVESYVMEYPVGLIAQKTVNLVKEIIAHFHEEQLEQNCEKLLRMTPEYHNITVIILPRIKFFTKEIEQIRGALQTGSPNIEIIYHYYRSGKCQEEYKNEVTFLTQESFTHYS